MSKPPESAIPRLPRLAAGSSMWRLPLTEHAASELARVLVMDVPAERGTPLAELMSVDPALTLWTTCAAGRWGGSAPRCVVDLAGWLSQHVASVLKWSPSDLPVQAEQKDVRARWRELSANAIAVANLAADRASNDAAAAEAFLFGLVHNGADWLRSCGPRISIAKGDHGCLPSWLVALLQQRSRSSRSEPVQQVMLAGKTWRDAGRRGRRVAGVDLADVARARQRWQTDGVDRNLSRHFLWALTEKLQRLTQLEHQFERTLEQEKLQSLGELAYGASHEINNPLANISTRAQAMLAEETDPERRRMLAIINTQAFRANEMIADMMLFARPPEPVRQEVDLVEIVQLAIDELKEEAELQGTLLRRLGDTDRLLLAGDPAQLATALRAICLNALESLGAEGEVDLEIDELPAAAGDRRRWARVRIRDTGPGIPPEVRRHLFDPFFSGREAGRGLGLGLAKTWRVITMHGGRIEVVSQERRGSTFSILLPMQDRLKAED